MKNDNSKMVGRRLIRSYLTSVISISLVLFLVALAAAFGYDMFMLSYAQLCRPPSPAA